LKLFGIVIRCVIGLGFFGIVIRSICCACFTLRVRNLFKVADSWLFEVAFIEVTLVWSVCALRSLALQNFAPANFYNTEGTWLIVRM